MNKLLECIILYKEFEYYNGEKKQRYKYKKCSQSYPSQWIAEKVYEYLKTLGW